MRFKNEFIMKFRGGFTNFLKYRRYFTHEKVRICTVLLNFIVFKPNSSPYCVVHSSFGSSIVL